MEDNQIPSWRTVAILALLLVAVTTCQAQSTYSPQGGWLHEQLSADNSCVVLIHII
jgi:hypothetical protein